MKLPVFLPASPTPLALSLSLSPLLLIVPESKSLHRETETRNEDRRSGRRSRKGKGGETRGRDEVIVCQASILRVRHGIREIPRGDIVIDHGDSRMILLHRRGLDIK